MTVVLLVLESEDVEDTDEVVLDMSELVVEEAAAELVVGVGVADTDGGVLLAADDSVVVVDVSVSVVESWVVDVFELPVPRL